MNETLGRNIARLRKEKGMTQDELARELNISYQAVSKWENGISSPDIVNLKHLAEIFGVSIDELFGMELEPKDRALILELEDIPSPEISPEAPQEDAKEENTDKPVKKEEPGYLPWADDGTLRAVLFRGRELVSYDELGGLLRGRNVKLEYKGAATSVFSFFDVECEAVTGDVQAGGDVECENVGGSVTASGDVNCEYVGAAVSCGGDVDCGDVGGDVRAGGDVDCGTVIGGVQAGGDVDCGSVGGDVTAGDDVNCGSVKGRVSDSEGRSRASRADADYIETMVNDIVRDSIAAAFSGIRGFGGSFGATGAKDENNKDE